MERTLKINIISLLVSIVIASCVNKADNLESSSENLHDSVTLEVQTLQVNEDTIPIAVHGVVSPERELKLSFKTGGIIQQLLPEGRMVEKGQEIGRLDLTEIKEKLRQARQAYEKAERDLERVRNLYQDSIGTLEQVQDIRTKYEVTKSDYNIARFNLKHSVIVAPARGFILKKLMHESEMVSSGMPVYLFAAESHLNYIKAGVSEKDILWIQEGDRASVVIPAIQDEPLYGYVTAISEIPQPYTGTYEVKIRLHGDLDLLRTGFTAQVSIFPSQTHRFYTIPYQAVLETQPGKIKVSTYSGHEVKEVWMELIQLSDTCIFAKTNDSLNIENVITAGLDKIEEGLDVKVLELDEK